MSNKKQLNVNFVQFLLNFFDVVLHIISNKCKTT